MTDSTKLMSETQLRKRLSSRYKMAYLNGVDGEKNLENWLEETVRLIDEQKKLYADAMLAILETNIGDYPDDIHLYGNESRGMWEERRRNRDIVAEMRQRNV